MTSDLTAHAQINWNTIDFRVQQIFVRQEYIVVHFVPFELLKIHSAMLCVVVLGFMVSCFKAWWTVMRTRWSALGPAWCRGWAQRWPCLFSCCRTSPAHPLLWLQLPPSQLEWRAVGAGAGPWVPICTRSSLICETETLPVILAKSALPVTAPNFHSRSTKKWKNRKEKKLHTLLKTSRKLLYSLEVIKIHSSARLEVTETFTSRECRNAHRVDIRVWLLLYCISYTLGLREPPLHRLFSNVSAHS